MKWVVIFLLGMVSGGVALYFALLWYFKDSFR